ncbi:hypothetical protein K2X33_10565 [bacterium]|nr:hypothetical protein [bacterium]
MRRLALPVLFLAACSHTPKVADTENPQCRGIADKALAAYGEVKGAEDPWKEFAADPQSVSVALDALAEYPVPDRTTASLFDKALKNGGIADADVPLIFDAKGCSTIRFFRAWKITLATLRHYKLGGAERDRARTTLAHFLQTQPEQPTLIETLVRIQLAEWGVESGVFQPTKAAAKRLAALRSRAAVDKDKIRISWKKLESLEKPEDYQNWTEEQKSQVKKTLFEELSMVNGLNQELSSLSKELSRNPA